MSQIDILRNDVQLPPESVARLRLGTFIKNKRREMGMHGRDLAAQVGISPSNLSRIERGERGVSLMSLAKLAQVLGVSELHLRYLAGIDEVEHAPVPAVEAELDRIRILMEKMTDVQRAFYADLVEACAKVMLARHAFPHPPMRKGAVSAA